MNRLIKTNSADDHSDAREPTRQEIPTEKEPFGRSASTERETFPGGTPVCPADDSRRQAPSGPPGKDGSRSAPACHPPKGDLGEAGRPAAQRIEDSANRAQD